MDLNLDLLKDVEKYRRKTLGHVAATLKTIHALDAGMREMRAGSPHCISLGIRFRSKCTSRVSRHCDFLILDEGFGGDIPDQMKCPGPRQFPYRCVDIRVCIP